MLLIRSLVYNALFYVIMLIMGIACAPLAVWSREGALWSCRRYTDVTLWLLKVICGTRVEVRGQPPTGNVMVASKHQSFLDILILANVLPQFNFIMKKELKWAPILGLYAMRLGAVPVDRGRKGQAVNQMVSDLEDYSEEVRQLVIYPQGTRVAPGAQKAYKVGAGVIYQRRGVTCYPAATNAGLFWGRKTILRKPGVAVVEFLEPIAPGMEVQPFIKELEARVETASDALMAEAGFRQ